MDASHRAHKAAPAGERAGYTREAGSNILRINRWPTPQVVAAGGCSYHEAAITAAASIGQPRS